MRDRLLELLKRDAYQPGRVTLSSGGESDYHIDCKRVTMTSEGHCLAGYLLIEALSGETAVAGVVLGGCPLASAVATISCSINEPVSAVYVRRTTERWMKAVEGADHLQPGTRIAVAEDVVTTGTGVLRTTGLLEDVGFVVSQVIALVDRLEGG